MSTNGISVAYVGGFGEYGESETLWWLDPTHPDPLRYDSSAPLYLTVLKNSWSQINLSLFRQQHQQSYTVFGQRHVTMIWTSSPTNISSLRGCLLYVFLQFILIFRKAQRSSLQHAGLVEIYRQLQVYECNQEDANPALCAFKAQVTHLL